MAQTAALAGQDLLRAASAFGLGLVQGGAGEYGHVATMDAAVEMPTVPPKNFWERNRVALVVVSMLLFGACVRAVWWVATSSGSVVLGMHEGDCFVRVMEWKVRTKSRLDHSMG